MAARGKKANESSAKPATVEHPQEIQPTVVHEAVMQEQLIESELQPSVAATTDTLLPSGVQETCKDSSEGAADLKQKAAEAKAALKAEKAAKQAAAKEAKKKSKKSPEELEDEKHLLEAKAELKAEKANRLAIEQKIKKVEAEIIAEQKKKGTLAVENLKRKVHSVEEQLEKLKQAASTAEQQLKESTTEFDRLAAQKAMGVIPDRPVATVPAIPSPGRELDINVGVAVHSSHPSKTGKAVPNGSLTTKGVQCEAMDMQPDRVTEMRLYHFLCDAQKLGDRKALYFIAKYGMGLVQLLDNPDAAYILQDEGLLRKTARTVKQRWGSEDGKPFVMGEQVHHKKTHVKKATAEVTAVPADFVTSSPSELLAAA